MGMTGDSEDAPPKVIMSKAARRKLKKPPVVVTAEMKEQQREDLRALRKHLRMVKSNGGRRKVRKEMEKRERDEDADRVPMDLDEDARPKKKGRRLESSGYVPPVQTLPNHMLPKPVTQAEEVAMPAAAAGNHPRPIQSKKGPTKRGLDLDGLW